MPFSTSMIVIRILFHSISLSLTCPCVHDSYISFFTFRTFAYVQICIFCVEEIFVYVFIYFDVEVEIVRTPWLINIDFSVYLSPTFPPFFVAYFVFFPFSLLKGIQFTAILSCLRVLWKDLTSTFSSLPALAIVITRSFRFFIELSIVSSYLRGLSLLSLSLSFNSPLFFLFCLLSFRFFFLRATTL